MDCYVCFERMEVYMSASFGCSPHHAMCARCYARLHTCPLCRYSPYLKPPVLAVKLLANIKYPETCLNYVNMLNAIIAESVSDHA
jgi:hypothetical protein